MTVEGGQVAPPEPGLRYMGTLQDLALGGLEAEIVAAAQAGCTVVVTADGVYWRQPAPVPEGAQR